MKEIKEDVLKWALSLLNKYHQQDLVGSLTKESFLKRFNDNRLIIKDGIGLISWSNYKNKDSFLIERLAIEEKYFGSGEADKLLNKVEQIANEQGIKYLIAHVRKKNKRALNFFKKNGFKEIGLVKEPFVKSELVEMKKVLNNKVEKLMSKVFSVMGGLQQIWKRLNRIIPEHKRYVEVFGGTGELFWEKEPSEEEIHNDINKDYSFILNFVRNADEETISKLKKYNWHSSETLFYKLRDSKPKNDIEKFRRLIYLLRFRNPGSMDLDKSIFGTFYKRKPRSIKIENKFKKEKQERLKNLKFTHLDFRDAIKKFDSKDTLFFLDPPYAKNEIMKGLYYKFVLKEEDFKDLADLLSKIKGKFILVIYGEKEILDYFRNKGFKEFNFRWKMKYKVGKYDKENRFPDFKVASVFVNYSPIHKFEEEIVKEKPDFVWIPNFISLTGSKVYEKHEPHDLDIVIKLPRPVFSSLMQNSPDIIEALGLKISRLFDRKDIHWIPSSIGPNWDNEPLFDLVLKPSKSGKQIINEPSFKKICYLQELRSAKEEIIQEAKISQKEDKVEPLRFFLIMKTRFDAIMADEEKGKYDTSEVKEFLDRQNLYGRIIAQKKYDGNCVEILKKKDIIKIYSEDGKEVNYERIPLLLEEIKKLKIDTFSICAEIEIWKDNKHLNREDVAGYLHSKGSSKDEGLVANIFDIVYFKDKDIHNLDVIERIKFLEEFGIKQSTIEIPENSINLSPSFLVKENNVDEILLKLAKSPASEGAMLKWGRFSLNGRGTILKWKKYEELKAIVLKVNKTKVPTVFNYEIGVRFKDENIDKDTIWQINDKKYHHIGRTYNTNVICKIGDIVSIRFHTINLYDTPNGLRLNTYEPIFSEKIETELEPDYFDKIIERAKLSNLLITKTEKLIEDLENYNPVEIEDTRILRDDMRILLAWLSSDIKKYDEELMKAKLRELILELFRRGDTLLQPDSYKRKSKEIMMEALKDIVKKGIYLVEPHPRLIVDGKKKLIIKARNYENMLNQPLWLASKGKVFGIVKLI